MIDNSKFGDKVRFIIDAIRQIAEEENMLYGSRLSVERIHAVIRESLMESDAIPTLSMYCIVYRWMTNKEHEVEKQFWEQYIQPDGVLL